MAISQISIKVEVPNPRIREAILRALAFILRCQVIVLPSKIKITGPNVEKARPLADSYSPPRAARYEQSSIAPRDIKMGYSCPEAEAISRLHKGPKLVLPEIDPAKIKQCHEGTGRPQMQGGIVQKEGLPGLFDPKPLKKGDFIFWWKEGLFEGYLTRFLLDGARAEVIGYRSDAGRYEGEAVRELVPLKDITRSTSIIRRARLSRRLKEVRLKTNGVRF